MFTVIRAELSDLLRTVRIVIDCPVYGRLLIQRTVPLPCHGDHFLHVLSAGAEDNVFAALFHIFAEELCGCICLFQCMTQSVQQFRAVVLYASPLSSHPSGQLTKFIPVIIHSADIYRCRQDSLRDSLCQLHPGCDLSCEQFLCHIPSVIQITDIGRGQSQYFRLGTGFQQ